LIQLPFCYLRPVASLCHITQKTTIEEAISHEIMDTSNTGQAVQLFKQLESHVIHLKLHNEAFPEPATIDGITVRNIPELMNELSRLHLSLSDLDFLPYYRSGAAIISDMASEKISGWAEILESYEEVGNTSEAFRLFKQSPQYDREFVVFKTARDWRISNQKQVETGLAKIPEEWPTIGRKLLAFEDRPTDSYVRQLRAMCGRFTNETTAIHRINRAMLIRLDDENTRNKKLVPNYADIRSAKALPITFKVPLASEIRDRGLYFDSIGLITKDPPERQSYAETEVSSTPARTSARDVEDTQGESHAHLQQSTTGKGRVGLLLEGDGEASHEVQLETDGETNPLVRGADLEGDKVASPGREAGVGHTEVEEQVLEENLEADEALEDSPEAEVGVDANPEVNLEAEMAVEENSREELEDDENSREELQDDELEIEELEDDEPEIEGSPNAEEGADAEEDVEDNAGEEASPETEPDPEAEGQGDPNEATREADRPSPSSPFIVRSIAPTLRLPRTDAEWDYLMKDIMANVKGLSEDPRLSLEKNGYADISLFEYLEEDGELHATALQEVEQIMKLTRKETVIHWASQFSIIQQIVQQDLLHYLLHVCIRKAHPIELCIYPQPTITTNRSTELNEPFSVPVALNWNPEMFEQSLAGYVPLKAETETACDHLLTTRSGSIQSIGKLKSNYEGFLKSRSETLRKATMQHIDVSGMVSAYPEEYKVQATPLPKPGNLRVMRPWVPRAHQGKGDRHVIMPTLVSTMERATASPFDLIFPSNGPTASDRANTLSTESGMRVSTVTDMNKSQSTTAYGPWGSCDKGRRLDRWDGWSQVQGLSPISDALLGVKPWSHHTVIAQLNVLFCTNPKRAHKRWDLIASHRRLLVAFALDAIHRFIAETDAPISASRASEDDSSTGIRGSSTGQKAGSKRARKSAGSTRVPKKQRTSKK
jgi:hypothetical protein